MAGVQCREDSIAGASSLPDKKEQWGLGKESKGKERLAAVDRALVRRLLGRQQQQARQWLGRCKKREHAREALGSYTKC
jgi:hypothetical protein